MQTISLDCILQENNNEPQIVRSSVDFRETIEIKRLFKADSTSLHLDFYLSFHIDMTQLLEYKTRRALIGGGTIGTMEHPVNSRETQNV